ncbi:cytoplasmic protein [Moniliophthora roreri MCA 2997]|uniref:Cytoplasmic protein n=2 Tax=Moniliophthora roreri TaxID=221103 RepID=V2XUY4_MONRO|nr:cytoplasmic protein [Moniliophthora roreri MCA 2997]
MPLEPNNESKARGANRSTKVAGKLKVLPEQPEPPVLDVKSRGKRIHVSDTQDETATATTGDSDDGDIDEDSDEGETVEVYNQISLIPEGTARRDAIRLTKKKAKSLPRVTAYATASSFRMDDVMKFLNARRTAYGTNVRLIDDVLYSPYSYQGPSNDDAPNSSTQSRIPHEGDLLGVPELQLGVGDEMRTVKRKSKFEASSNEAEIFLFEYGTVVIWGMSEAQERRFLSSLKRFEVEKLAPEDVEMEDLNYYYANYSRIYNDVITLRKGSNYMTKLSLSHALSQSVKISLFEKLISNTVEETKDIPEIISETGKIGMPHKEIMQQIGQLFLLRTNINSVGSVLDSPEVFWSYPDQQPLYDAARSYLEIPQRINLLNTRVEVLQDMLQLLKESVSSKHAERLEQIVIALIGIEIVLGIVTILVDLLA